MGIGEGFFGDKEGYGSLWGILRFCLWFGVVGEKGILGVEVGGLRRLDGRVLDVE